MADVSDFRSPIDRIAENPAIDPKVVAEAERAREELEALGVWKKNGARVTNPYEASPNAQHHRQEVTPAISQGR